MSGASRSDGLRTRVSGAVSIFLSVGHTASRHLSRGHDRRRHPTRAVSVTILDGQSVEEFDGSGLHLYAGTEKRYATANEVAWLPDDRIVVDYLLSDTIAVFDASLRDGAPVLEPIAEIRDGAAVASPAGLVVTQDGRWLFVASQTGGTVSAFDLGAEKPDDLARSVGSLDVAGASVLHGMAIDPEGTHILVTSIGGDGGIWVARRVDDGSDPVALDIVSFTENEHSPLKPKSVAITPDGRFVVVALGANVARRRNRPSRGRLEIRRFDSRTGTIGDVVATSLGVVELLVPESVAISPDGDAVLVTDQADDKAVVLSFDPETGRLGEVTHRIGRAAGGLSFPHGCAFSPDGRWIAVTNYGDASVRIYPSEPDGSVP